MTSNGAAAAPIILFAYRRPDHLRRVIAALRANPLARLSSLVLSCDGPKGPDDVERCAAVHAIACAVDGFANVEVRRSVTNVGLAGSVIAGVTNMLQAHERVIVLEDDLVVSPHFLTYMNEGLSLYASDATVANIHGYCYPVHGLPETYFLRGADCWGWATWARAWSHFNPDGSSLRRAIKAAGLEDEFDLDGAYAFTHMLDEQIAGRNDSWAIRWHASCFLNNLLTLYPGRSLVHNIGHDGSGTHSRVEATYDQTLTESPVRISRVEVAESRAARAAIAKYFRSQPLFWRRKLALLARAGARIVKWR